MCSKARSVASEAKQSRFLGMGNGELGMAKGSFSFLACLYFCKYEMLPIFGRPTVVMTGPEANQFLFANENKYFAATWPKSTRILPGPASLATQTGSFHQQRRKLIDFVAVVRQ